MASTDTVYFDTAIWGLNILAVDYGIYIYGALTY